MPGPVTRYTIENLQAAIYQKSKQENQADRFRKYLPDLSQLKETSELFDYEFTNSEIVAERLYL